MSLISSFGTPLVCASLSSLVDRHVLIILLHAYDHLLYNAVLVT